MEAMAAKTIVLARFDTNLSNVIIDGETGFFFTDEDSFIVKAHHILTMNQEEHDKIIQGSSDIVQTYSMDKFYSNIMGVYLRAIKKCW
jgi:1,2-diacylglycerol 3-alpha-glucosyltransferase